MNLLTAQYDLRKDELDVLGNEFVGAIDAQKNQLTLDEAKHHLQQLQQDAASRLATSAAALDVVVEKRNKADLAMKRAQGIIDNLAVKSSIDGVVSVKENRDGQMFYYSGMTLPEFREGDTTFSGRNVADVIEQGKMEAHAKVTETDRDNLQQGQSAAIQIDALPGRTFEAKVGALTGSASRGNFFETSAVRQFDIGLALDHPDPLMRAGSSPARRSTAASEERHPRAAQMPSSRRAGGASVLPADRRSARAARHQGRARPRPRDRIEG